MEQEHASCFAQLGKLNGTVYEVTQEPVSRSLAYFQCYLFGFYQWRQSIIQGSETLCHTWPSIGRAGGFASWKTSLPSSAVLSNFPSYLRPAVSVCSCVRFMRPHNSKAGRCVIENWILDPWIIEHVKILFPSHLVIIPSASQHVIADLSCKRDPKELVSITT